MGKAKRFTVISAQGKYWKTISLSKTEVKGFQKHFPKVKFIPIKKRKK